MISAPGNKRMFVTALVAFSVIAFLFASVISQRRGKIRLLEKEYSLAVSALEEMNGKDGRGQGAGFSE